MEGANKRDVARCCFQHVWNGIPDLSWTSLSSIIHVNDGLFHGWWVDWLSTSIKCQCGSQFVHKYMRVGFHSPFFHVPIPRAILLKILTNMCHHIITNITCSERTQRLHGKNWCNNCRLWLSIFRPWYTLGPAKNKRTTVGKCHHHHIITWFYQMGHDN